MSFIGVIKGAILLVVIPFLFKLLRSPTPVPSRLRPTDSLLDEQRLWDAEALQLKLVDDSCASSTFSRARQTHSPSSSQLSTSRSPASPSGRPHSATPSSESPRQGTQFPSSWDLESQPCRRGLLPPSNPSHYLSLRLETPGASSPRLASSNPSRSKSSVSPSLSPVPHKLADESPSANQVPQSLAPYTLRRWNSGPSWSCGARFFFTCWRWCQCRRLGCQSCLVGRRRRKSRSVV